MPVYEYECRGCKDRFEVLQRITDSPLETCEQCGGELAKLISNTSFVLKGGGWYQDGYASPKAQTSQDKTTEKKSTGKQTSSEKKTDSGASTKKKSKKTVGAAG